MIVKKLALSVVIFTGLQIFPGAMMAQEIDYKGFPQWTWHKEDSTEYYLYTPANMEPGKKYPVALFMHGCCGIDYHATLRNTVDPPVRMWHNFGANTQAIPTYIIAPATSRGWKQHFANLKKVMDELITSHNADPQRIYVCGFSMGGEGTYGIIQQYPGYFAAAIPMGMSFKGDSSTVKDIPIWANQGETDWFSRNLKKQVAAIRILNGYTSDTGNTWVTGVNPRYSNFKGIGHGVQWNAASTQDLTGWAYSKINDGNKYPHVFFIKPTYAQQAEEGEETAVEIFAKDPDGIISTVELYQNKKLVRSLKKQPFTTTIIPAKGDNLIEAIAYDNKGKFSVATTVVKVNSMPALILNKLPDAISGSYYEQKLIATGNGNILFTTDPASKLPPGIQLYPGGILKGIPLEKGLYRLTIRVTDEDNEFATGSYSLFVAAKIKNEVLVTNPITMEGVAYKISKMLTGETPWFNSKDTVPTSDTEEINFSNLDNYEGLTYIKTDINDAGKSGDGFLSFDIDENAMVYVAYEILDNLKHSTIPKWLRTFKKEPGKIVAQYRYFNVYSKRFAKGSVLLPAADAKANNIGSNYFVMVRKSN
ncbi:MAG: putative Ig domain-containing protein [Ferruginibacter sp.]